MSLPRELPARRLPSSPRRMSISPAACRLPTSPRRMSISARWVCARWAAACSMARSSSMPAWLG
eukprot:scaffold2234_cov66-Phaeocystis_antarctica.AAC.3